MRILFIDDERMPKATRPDKDELVVVRSNEEAKVALLAGPWDEVWFDHDLGVDVKLYLQIIDEKPGATVEDLHPAYVTTRPLARWLIENKEQVEIKRCILVHSLNADGGDWLMDMLKNYGVPVYRQPLS